MCSQESWVISGQPFIHAAQFQDLESMAASPKSSAEQHPDMAATAKKQCIGYPPPIYRLRV